MIKALILIILGAVGNRIRGGLFGDKIRKFAPYYGTTLGRVLYGLLIGSGALLFGSSLSLAVLLVGTTVLGHAIAPFSPFQFMERSNDVFVMSLRGLILVGASAVAIMSLHSVLAGIIFLIPGLLMGPTYKLTSVMPIVPFINDNPATESTNDTAEILFGVLTFTFLILSFTV